MKAHSSFSPYFTYYTFNTTREGSSLLFRLHGIEKQLWRTSFNPLTCATSVIRTCCHINKLIPQLVYIL